MLGAKGLRSVGGSPPGWTYPRGGEHVRGLTTITYSADNVDDAAQWYAQVLGVEPYFRKDFAEALAYVEFRLGDYSHELGILDRRYPRPTAETQGGVVAYWAVNDVNPRIQAASRARHRFRMRRSPSRVPVS